MIAARHTSSPGIFSNLIIFLVGSNSFILKVTFKSVLLSLFALLWLPRLQSGLYEI